MSFDPLSRASLGLRVRSTKSQPQHVPQRGPIVAGRQPQIVERNKQNDCELARYMLHINIHCKCAVSNPDTATVLQ